MRETGVRYTALGKRLSNGFFRLNYWESESPRIGTRANSKATIVKNKMEQDLLLEIFHDRMLELLVASLPDRDEDNKSPKPSWWKPHVSPKISRKLKPRLPVGKVEEEEAD